MKLVVHEKEGNPFEGPVALVVDTNLVNQVLTPEPYILLAPARGVGLPHNPILPDLFRLAIKRPGNAFSDAKMTQRKQDAHHQDRTGIGHGVDTRGFEGDDLPVSIEDSQGHNGGKYCTKGDNKDYDEWDAEDKKAY